MSAIDIFTAVVIIGFVLGLLLMIVSFIGLTGMGAIKELNNVTTQNPVGSTIVGFGNSFYTFFPSLTVIFVFILIIESWMLSAFLKSHPLAAVVGIVFLVFYTIISFFVSNYAVMLLKNPVFNNLVSHNMLLALFYLNMPTILVISTIVDIFIGVLALRYD
ncbi:MAG: hypothetical protein ACP5HW_03675 [Candidatus Micrarchaeia archaeon]